MPRVEPPLLSVACEHQGQALQLALRAGEIRWISPCPGPLAERLLRLVCGFGLAGEGEAHVDGLPAECWTAPELASRVVVLRDVAKQFVGPVVAPDGTVHLRPNARCVIANGWFDTVDAAVRAERLATLRRFVASRAACALILGGNGVREATARLPAHRQPTGARAGN